MAISPVTYTPPGVTVSELLTGPQVSPTLASPADVCIVGMSGNFTPGSPASYQVGITATDSLPSSAVVQGTAIILPTLAQQQGGASLVSILSVTNTQVPGTSGYIPTTDFTVNTSNGTITPVTSGGIPSGTAITVTYSYIPANYYQPIRFYDIGSVETRFGTSLNVAGNAINSPISFAARQVLNNGAGSVICQPLFINNGSPAVPTQPTNAQMASTTAWANTLLQIRNIENLDIIVPVIGQNDMTTVSQSSANGPQDSALIAIWQQIQSHLTFMNQNEQYIFAFFGEDSTGGTTTNAGQMATIRTHAANLQAWGGGTISQQMALINTASFGYAISTSGTGQTILPVGGQYVAAAIAGAVAGRPVSSSLTRKSINGVSSVLDNRLLSDKNTDASLALMVVEQAGGIVRVRHSITLDNTSGAARAEVSVVRAKFVMIASIKNTLENNIIGNIIADGNSPYIVRSAIVGVLALLQQAGDLVSYTTPNVAISSIDPTTITATFSYRPSFPVNYITVSFSLDLSAQTVTAANTSDPGSTT